MLPGHCKREGGVKKEARRKLNVQRLQRVPKAQRKVTDLDL